MTIRVRLFASLAQVVGQNELDLTLSDNATVGDAVERLSELHPPLNAHQSHLATAVNLDYVGSEHRLCNGDELALIPPVSGG